MKEDKPASHYSRPSDPGTLQVVLLFAETVPGACACVVEGDRCVEEDSVSRVGCENSLCVWNVQQGRVPCVSACLLPTTSKPRAYPMPRLNWNILYHRASESSWLACVLDPKKTAEYVHGRARTLPLGQEDTGFCCSRDRADGFCSFSRRWSLIPRRRNRELGARR